MLKYLFHFLTGYVIIKIEGGAIEHFLNLCAAEKLRITGLKWRGSQYATGEILPSVYHRIKLFARDNGCKISVIRRGGMPFMLKRMKKRKVLLVSFFVVLFILFWLCSRIWVIDIAEHDPEKRAEIAMILEKNGVKAGMPRHALKPFVLQQEVLGMHRQFSWFWVEIKGTHATVEVRYSKTPPEVVPADKICNIVASKNGIIQRMVVRSGKPMVKEGASVKEGQLLVSGVVPNSYISAMYVHSDADITARTNVTLSKSASTYITKRIKTGKHEKKYSVSIAGKNFNLFFKTPDFKHYDGEIIEKRLRLFGDFYMPVTVRTYEYHETNPTTHQVSAENVEAELKAALYMDLCTSVGEANILAYDYHTENTGEVITVTIKAECIENITLQEEITFENRPFLPIDINKDTITKNKKTEE